MAIQKETQWKGLTASYWKIIDVKVDYQRGHTTTTVGLYANKEAREQDVQNYLTKYQYVFQKIFPHESAEDLRDQLYNEMLEMEQQISEDEEGNPIMSKTFEGGIKV